MITVRKFLDTFRKNSSLDPSRKETVFTIYDEERGYRAFHEHCKTFHEQTLDDETDDALIQCGIEHIQALEERTASDALKAILTTSNSSVQKENIDYSEILTVPDRNFITTLFEKIFTQTLDQKLKRYFKSAYCIYWHTFLRTIPSPQARRSFLWHCDKGPSCHIKLLVYLNGTDEHGGNTDFLDRSTTAAFAKTGYLFGPVDARQSDLAQLAKQHHIDFNPLEWEMKPGDGILFEPSQILHSGILPTKGPRYVLTFCLLPSPIPWHKAFSRTNGEPLAENYRWHENADDIRKALI
ncbi:MAG: hypothetical protein ACPGYT_14745 [Nitrospirales bacterium]